MENNKFGGQKRKRSDLASKEALIHARVHVPEAAVLAALRTEHRVALEGLVDPFRRVKYLVLRRYLLISENALSMGLRRGVYAGL